VCAHFGEAFLRVHPGWLKDVRYAHLREVVEELSNMLPGTSLGCWGLDRVWGAIDNRAKLCRAVGRRDFGADVSVQIHRAVAHVFGPRLNEDIARVVEGEQSNLRTILEGLQGPVRYVSFNYDLLMDGLAGRLGASVIKPHGSLNLERQVPDGGWPPRTLPGAMGPDDVRMGTQPAIIGPVQFKSELTIEVQKATDCLGFHGELTYQWRQLVDHLALCDTLVVVGYGFPPEDVYAVHLFREAALRRRERGAEALGLHVYQADEGAFRATIENLKRIFFRGDDVRWPEANVGPIDNRPAGARSGTS